MIAEPGTSVRVKYNVGWLRVGQIVTVLPPNKPNETTRLGGTPDGWTSVKWPYDPALKVVQPFGFEVPDDNLEVIDQ